MTKKFLQIVARHKALAQKAAAGKADEKELAELEKLSKAIDAAVGTDDSAPAETTLMTMSLKEYQEWHETAVKSIEAGEADEKLLALVKRNLAAVKAQKKTKSDELVAVEMPVAKSAEDKFTALEDRIAELEAKLKAKDEGDSSGKPTDDDDAGEDDGEPSSKQDGKSTAQALAMEAIDALLEKYGKIKALVDSGSLTKESMRDLYEGDWQLKDILSQAAAIMAKADELKSALEACLPELEKLAKAEGPEDEDGDGEGDGEGDEDGAGDDEGDGEGEGGEGGEEEASKGDGEDGNKVSEAWSMGTDLSPKIEPEEHAKEIQKASKNRTGL